MGRRGADGGLRSGFDPRQYPDFDRSIETCAKASIPRLHEDNARAGSLEPQAARVGTANSKRSA